MLSVGIIGAGDFGAQHAQAIAQLENIQLVAASRTNATALSQFTRRFGGQGYTDYHQLLADTSIDAVIIATPHDQHTEIVAAAAKARKHILLEKPMAPTVVECNLMLTAAEQAGVKLMVGHISHFVPAYQKAKTLLEAGELGDIVYANSTMARPWMTANRRDWHLDRERGGGMWLTIGVHVLDQLCWLIDAPVTSISAELQTRFHRQQADDVGIALLRYANQTTATASCIGYQSGVFSFVTELHCSRGQLRIDHSKGVFVGHNESWQPIPDSASEDWMAAALCAEWQAFASALENNRAMPISGDYARSIIHIANAAEQSSQQRKEIALE